MSFRSMWKIDRGGEVVCGGALAIVALPPAELDLILAGGATSPRPARLERVLLRYAACEWNRATLTESKGEESRVA